MAKHNVLFETDNFIPHCMNRAGVADFDIDGGSPVVEGAVDSKNKELYALAKPTATSARVAVAYNPSVKYDVINGKVFPAHSTDDRDYTNPAGKAVDYFFPEVGVEFGVLAAGVDGSTAPVVGDFLEPTTTAKFAIKKTQTDAVASFKVVDIKDAKYPTGDFSDDIEKVYIVKTAFNG